MGRSEVENNQLQRSAQLWDLLTNSEVGATLSLQKLFRLMEFFVSFTIESCYMHEVNFMDARHPDFRYFSNINDELDRYRKDYNSTLTYFYKAVFLRRVLDCCRQLRTILDNERIELEMVKNFEINSIQDEQMLQPYTWDEVGKQYGGSVNQLILEHYPEDKKANNQKE